MSDKDGFQERIEALPREIEPPRDLWPGIERRISATSAPPAETRSRRGWRGEWIAAAAAILVFVAGWGVAKLGPDLTGGPGGAPGDTSGTPMAADPDAAAPAATGELDAGYVAASEQLMNTLAQSDLDPELIAQIQSDLQTMDTAVQGFRDALAERPDDPRLQRQLNDEVHRRGNVLRRLAGIQIAGLQLGENQ